MTEQNQTTGWASLSPFRKRLIDFRLCRSGYAKRVGYRWRSVGTRWFGKRNRKRIVQHAR